MVDAIFRNQGKWDPEFGVLDAHGGLVQLGMSQGMTPAQINKCMADTRDEARINKVAAEAEQRYALTGTPTFVINGVAQPSGAFPYPALAHLLDTAPRRP